VLALPPVPHAVMVDLFDPQRRDDLEIVTPAERTQSEVARLLPDVDVVLGDWSPSLRLLEPGPRPNSEAAAILVDSDQVG
jgi:hypothetical protein